MKVIHDSFFLFSKNIERINLWLPVLFLLGAGVEIFSNFRFLGNLSALQSSILANIILLNITHNAFTYMLLTSSDTMKEWVNNQGGALLFWKRQAWELGLFSLFFLVLLSLSNDHREFFVIFTLINFGFAAHHALSQSFGLSLLYNRQMERTPKLVIAEKDERFLFKTFLYGNIIMGILFFLYIFQILTVPSQLVKPLLWLGAAVLCLFWGAMVLHTAKNYRALFATKGNFLWRYLLWPLTFFSPIAVFATTVIHGFEYLFVTEKMLRNDCAKKSRIGWLILLVVITFGFLRLETHAALRNREEMPFWMLVLTSISVAISFAHYKLDRHIFQMRHKENREAAGKLLFPLIPNKGSRSE